MSENNRHIDELFREELGSYTELPAPAVWASLETRLDAHYKTSPRIVPGPSYKWLWYALLALLTAVIVFFAVRSFTAKHSGVGMLTEPVENPRTYSDNNPPVTGNGGAVNNDDEDTEEAETENEHVKKQEAPVQTVEKADSKVPVDKEEKANEAKEAAGKTKAKHIVAAKANKEATIAKQKTAKSKTQNPKQTEQVKSSDGQAAQKPVAGKTKLAKSKAKQTKQAEQATGNEEHTPQKTVAKNKAAKSEVQKTKQSERAEQSVRNEEQAAQKPVAGKTKLAKSKAKQTKRGEQATGNEEQAAQKPVADKTKLANSKAKQTKRGGESTGSEEQLAKKPLASNTGPAKSKGGVQKQPEIKPASNTIAKKTNREKDAMKKPAIAAKANTGTNDENNSGASITAKKNTAKNKNTYAAATGSRKNAAGTINKKAAQKKPAVNKPAKQNTIPENDQPEWNVKEPTAAAKTNKQEDAKPKEPERNWRQGSDFTAKDNRKGSGIKMNDFLKNQNNAGDGNDEAGADDKEESAGGGGATAGYEEKDKKKKDKEGKKFMFEFGVKLGYEMGFGSYRANKGVIMPYLQYNLAPTIGLVIQPSLKYAAINKMDIGDLQSFYQITSSKLDSNHIIIPPDSFGNPGTIARNYSYSQLHDSIVIKHAIAKKTYFEFELPVMLQYKLAKNFGVYFGVSVNYSKIAQIEEYKNTYTGILRQDKLSYAAVPDSAKAPVIPSPDNRFSYDYEPYSRYNPAAVANTTTNPFRFNYMIGFNYLIADRILLDVMYTKALSNQNYIPDARVREIYKQGYLRISLGYKFSK